MAGIFDARSSAHVRRAGIRLNGIHPPKREVFDVTAGTNTDNKGFVRAVDRYERTPWGLYLARPTPGRAQFNYLQSWLLPDLGLRATVYDWNPGHERPQDYYLDIADITVKQGDSGELWHTEDHYLDLVVYRGERTDVVDIDEFLAAHLGGLLSDDTAQRALSHTLTAVAGLAAHGHDLGEWLAGSGMPIWWR